VSPAEVDFYTQNGWAKLDNIISPVLTAQLLDIAQRKMGKDADRSGLASRGARYVAWVNGSEEDDWLRSLSQSRELGSIASALAGGRQLRWYTDIFMAKKSAENGGARTPWHQDYPHQAFDRRGAIAIWIPLVDCPPNKGSMRFLSGSHRAGPLGRYATRTDDVDVVSDYPHLLEEYEISPPLYLKVGDATVHDYFTIHSAPDNLTNSTRWVYGVSWFPAETLYNGSFSLHTKGLELDKPFPDARFPIVSE